MSSCQVKYVNLPHLCPYTHINEHIYKLNGEKLKIINKTIQFSYNLQHGINNTH